MYLIFGWNSVYTKLPAKQNYFLQDHIRSYSNEWNFLNDGLRKPCLTETIQRITSQ